MNSALHPHVSEPWSTYDAQRTLRTGFVVVAVLVLAQTAGHLVSVLTAGATALDVNGERTVAAAVSATVVLVAAMGCRALARWTGERWTAVLAGLLGFLAVDEVLVIHEKVGVVTARVLGLSDAWDSVLWPLMYLPLLALVLAMLVLVAHQADRRVGRTIRLGLGLLVAAVGLEVLSAPFSTASTADGLVHALEGMVEEGFELAGWGLISTGVVAAAVAARALAVRSGQGPTGGDAVGLSPRPRQP